MNPPRTALGQRRLRLLRLLAVAPAPLLTSDFSAKLGWCPKTTRAHLQRLEELGLVTRVNYRRWVAQPGFTVRSLDVASIDALDR